MYRSCQDIFVFDTQISQGASVFVFGIHWLLLAFGNLYNKYVTTFHFNGLHVIVYLRMAIKLCGRLNHILFFVRTYSGYFSIVFYTYQQTSSICIGKGRESFGDFSRIGNFKFKVLLLVFSFGNQCLYIVCICKLFHGCKSREKTLNRPFYRYFWSLN